MINARDRALYKAAALTFGDNHQMTVATEELAELAQQICKVQRGKFDERHLTEEIADALNCIEQVILLLGISDAAIRRVRNRKKQRLIKTIADTKGVTEEVITEWIRNLETI